jgi:excisionase family DNA binding protein
MIEYLRSGQVAKELNVSSHHIRRLCEAGQIAAELTRGQHWRIPISEVKRLKAEGVPPIPTDADDKEEQPAPLDEDAPDGLYAPPSDELIHSAESVKVRENQLHERRLERDLEECEDWFRARLQQQAAKEEEKRRRAEAARAQEARREWLQKWIQVGLHAVP